MHRIKRFFVQLLVILLAVQSVVSAELLTIKSARADTDPAVVINEVMWMGTTASTSDEWIELRNTTNDPIDLTNWQLTNSATSGSTLTIPTLTIPANGYFLISNYGESDANTVLDVEADWVTTSISFANTCAQIDLINSASEKVDSMGCDQASKYFFPALSGTKHALERNVIIGDGLNLASWHESVGFAHLDGGRETSLDRATPEFVNDVTGPSEGSVATLPANYFDHVSGLMAQWQGFSDIESDVDSYQVGLSDNGVTANVIDFQSVAGSQSSHAFDLDPVTLTENQAYYALVVAVNGVGISSDLVASNSVVFREITPPDPFGLSSATDTPNDNGGSIDVTWQGSSADVTNYQVQYQPHGENWLNPATQDAGLNLSATVGGLQNMPASYDFRVLATSFNNTTTLSSNTLAAQAIDNLAPIIDSTKVVVSQNKPGAIDTIEGLSGASNDPSATITLLSAAPGDPNAVVINSALVATDGSWPALGIGDNQYAQVWLQLKDSAENLSTAHISTNDIVGPTAPVLTKLVANCDSDYCPVNLDWQSGSEDTASYKVNYLADGVSNQTFEVSATALAMSLPSDKSYQFSVIGYDQFGNPSSSSNVFTVALTRGVKTTVLLVDGVAITTTEGISGALEVSHTTVPAPLSSAEFVPKAQAAESTNEAITPTDAPLVQATDNSHDWIRIFVVVVLLLIIGGSFYALSRSVQEIPEKMVDKATGEMDKSGTKSTTRRRRGRRGRPRGQP